MPVKQRFPIEHNHCTLQALPMWGLDKLAQASDMHYSLINIIWTSQDQCHICFLLGKSEPAFKKIKIDYKPTKFHFC